VDHDRSLVVCIGRHVVVIAKLFLKTAVRKRSKEEADAGMRSGPEPFAFRLRATGIVWPHTKRSPSSAHDMHGSPPVVGIRTCYVRGVGRYHKGPIP
jgi:hypothetical protein